MDENLESLKHNADMKTYAEGEEPWRIKPAERGINIIVADQLAVHEQQIGYGLQIAAQTGNIIVIGKPKYITVERIIKALEELDPDIKVKYVKAVKRIHNKRAESVRIGTEMHERLERELEIKGGEELMKNQSIPFIIHAKKINDLPEIRLAKPNQIKHHEFKRTKPKRK